MSGWYHNILKGEFARDSTGCLTGADSLTAHLHDDHR